MLDPILFCLSLRKPETGLLRADHRRVSNLQAERLSRSPAAYRLREQRTEFERSPKRTPNAAYMSEFGRFQSCRTESRARNQPSFKPPYVRPPFLAHAFDAKRQRISLVRAQRCPLRGEVLGTTGIGPAQRPRRSLQARLAEIGHRASAETQQWKQRSRTK